MAVDYWCNLNCRWCIDFILNLRTTSFDRCQSNLGRSFYVPFHVFVCLSFDSSLWTRKVHTIRRTCLALPFPRCFIAWSCLYMTHTKLSLRQLSINVVSWVILDLASIFLIDINSECIDQFNSVKFLLTRCHKCCVRIANWIHAYTVYNAAHSLHCLSLYIYYL